MLFRNKPANLLHEMARYGLVAAIGLAVDFGGLVLLKEVFGIQYLVAASLSFVVALVVNYVLSSWWVFESKRNRAVEFSLFLMIGLVGLGLNDLLLWLLTSVGGLYYIFSKVVATALVFFWNFFGRKLLVYL